MSEAKKLFEELGSLIRETGKTSLNEAVLPISARNLQELAERVTKSWNRAYPEFAEARKLAYRIAATFGLPTRVSAGPKEVKNITRDTEDSLVTTIDWVARRFRSDYQSEVVKKGGDLRADVHRLAETARAAKDFADAPLKAAADRFVKEFLSFRTAVSDHLYRSVGAIVRRAEELVNRYLPQEQRPERPPSAPRGRRPAVDPFTALPDVADAADDIIERLDTFVHLSEPTIDEIERIAQLAEDVSAQVPPGMAVSTAPAEEPALPMEARRSRHKEIRPHLRKRVSEWLSLDWERDPEIGVFI